MDDLRPRFQALLDRAGLKSLSVNAVIAIIGMLILAISAGGLVWMKGEGPSSDIELPTTVSDPGAVTATPAPKPSVAASPTQIYVHIAGEVVHPDLYCLAAGARVAAGIAAAGGFTNDAMSEGVNLAKPLTDGEQVVVPDKHHPVATTASTAGAAGTVGAASAGQVNLNQADAAALDALPGVGPSTAAKILADREQNGPFKSPNDLGRVSGIGPKKLEQLQPLVTAP